MQSKMLPIHLRPLPGEVLSSWVSRLAFAHVFPLHFFRKQYLLATPGKRDIDQIEDPSFFDHLSEVTGIDVAVLWQMTYSSDEGSIHARRTDNNLQWVAPRTAIHSGKRRNLFPFCPGCLAEDATPYYRKAWRHSFLPICPEHGLLNLDCGHCGRPYSYLRTQQEERRLLVETGSLSHCRGCGERFPTGAAPALPEEVQAAALLVQQKIMNGLSDRFITVAGIGIVPICMYLAGLHIIHQTLQRKTDGQKFWRWIASQPDLPIEAEIPFQRSLIGTGADMSVESATPWAKAWLLVVADWFIGDWPNKFRNMLFETGDSLELTPKRFGYVPFWMLFEPHARKVKGARRDQAERAAC